MRTKTLLMTAAALAAGVIYTQAQTTVYSQNVVGYVNLTIPANGFNLIGNQLDLGPGSNSVDNVLTTGFLGAASGSGQSTLHYWTGSGFEVFYYYNATDLAGSGLSPGWYDGSGNPCTNTMGGGTAAFVQNPSAGAITTTLVGQVDQGTNGWVSVSAGFGFYAEPTPLAGTPIDSPSINFPATGPATGPGGTQDTYQEWTGNGYGPVLYYYDAATASPAPAGWYDGNGTLQDTNPAYWPNVGEGFVVQHAGSTSNWVSVFQVP